MLVAANGGSSGTIWRFSASRRVSSAPRKPGLHADGEVAWLVLEYAIQPGSGDGLIRARNGASHAALGAVASERNGVALRRGRTQCFGEFPRGLRIRHYTHTTR